ncbi:hypothetical protein BGX27_002344 [Mortierella sp. AM989]|nr:hypothetical protein BGX27_002344 [Mortierella sp. AM989]
MILNIDQLSLSEAALKAPSTTIHPLLTPPLDDGFAVTDMLATPIETAGVSLQANFPIKVTALPNKGRSYVATRMIQPQELVFVAEAFGTAMCDPWLDCGVCHYCWMTIQDRKGQVRLPRSEIDGQGKKKKLETVMVFCDETCVQLYGAETANMICRVEHKIRRTWNENGASCWEPRLSASTGQSTPTISVSSGDAAAVAAAAAAAAVVPALVSVTTHYSILIQQALSMADTPEAVLELNDQDQSCFLNNVWNALDGLIDEQESFLLDRSTESPDQKYTQKHFEAFYPTLATYLLEGNNNASIATRISDDDFETARLISEVLYRRQLDMQDKGLPSSQVSEVTKSTVQGERATFADYCAMQSNELALLRQQLILDISEREHDKDDIQDLDLDQEIGQEQDPDLRSHDHPIKQWRRLLSTLPAHLLGCFYIYLRLRDAYLLLSQEEKTTSATTLSIDNILFRTILYAEVANSFGIRDASDELLGFAVFPRACFFNHSCRPNIEKKRRCGDKARQMEYWSTRVIEQGEECCISYGDISKGRAERQSRLEDMYFFKCSCVRCIEEEEEMAN